MSNFSDNLRVYYADAVIFIGRFAEGISFTFSNSWFYMLFYTRIFSLVIIVTFVFCF